MTFPFRTDFSKLLLNSSKFLSCQWYLSSKILIDFNILLSFFMKNSQNLVRFVFLPMFFDRTDDKGLNLYTRSSLQGKQGLLLLLESMTKYVIWFQMMLIFLYRLGEEVLFKINHYFLYVGTYSCQHLQKCNRWVLKVTAEYWYLSVLCLTFIR